MQSSFSDLEYAAKKKQTRRDGFLAEIEPFYPKGEGRGRPPVGMVRMLRMYVAQQCFGLSDEGIEDAIYGSLNDRRPPSEINLVFKQVRPALSSHLAAVSSLRLQATAATAATAATCMGAGSAPATNARHVITGDKFYGSISYVACLMGPFATDRNSIYAQYTYKRMPVHHENDVAGCLVFNWSRNTQAADSHRSLRHQKWREKCNVPVVQNGRINCYPRPLSVDIAWRATLAPCFPTVVPMFLLCSHCPRRTLQRRLNPSSLGVKRKSQWRSKIKIG